MLRLAAVTFTVLGLTAHVLAQEPGTAEQLSSAIRIFVADQEPDKVFQGGYAAAIVDELDGTWTYANGVLSENFDGPISDSTVADLCEEQRLELRALGDFGFTEVRENDGNTIELTYSLSSFGTQFVRHGDEDEIAQFYGLRDEPRSRASMISTINQSVFVHLVGSDVLVIQPVNGAYPAFLARCPQ